MTKPHRRGFKQATLGTALTFGVLVAINRIRRSLGKAVSDYGNEKTTDDTLKIGLYPDVVDALPRRGVRYDNGKPNEPMNLILFGTAEAVYDAWINAGWYAADPVTPWALAWAWVILIVNGQYKHGPITPIMAAGHAQAMSFQKPTKLNSFRQRHHARIWATPYSSTGGLPIWIGHTSYDKDIKSIFKVPPAHEIDADLDSERQYTVSDLVKAGMKLRGYLALQPKHEGHNAFGDNYITDGKAAVLEISSNVIQEVPSATER